MPVFLLPESRLRWSFCPPLPRLLAGDAAMAPRADWSVSNSDFKLSSPFTILNCLCLVLYINY